MKKIITNLSLALNFCFLLTAHNGNAQFTKLLDFAGATNGANPSTNQNLIAAGNYLYGMTNSGGTSNNGLIFRLKPDGTSFDTLLNFNGTNGSQPNRSLIFDGTYFYGTTKFGGKNNDGVIFKIKQDGTGFDTLLNFNGTNGNNPCSGLFYDGSYLYGMTFFGGASGTGTVYKIKPDGTDYVDLLDFTGGANGGMPSSSLIFDGVYLYGVTTIGGAHGDGTIFKIKTDGTGYIDLLDFAGTTNGSNPYASLISDGTFLYGNTTNGGANNEGTIFKIKTDGTSYTKLLDFAGTTNGSYPNGALFFDGIYLYGTTELGGANNDGVIFKIKPDGTGYVDLMDFNGTATGSYGLSALISDGTYLYGMTGIGGANNDGTIFKYQYCTAVTSTQSPSVCAGQSVMVGVHTYTTQGTYTDTLKTVGGCDSIITTNLTVNALPIISINGDSSICIGATTTLTAHGAITYTWSTNAITTSITPSPTITANYTVTGTDVNNCTNTATSTVTVNNLPTLTLMAESYTACAGARDTLTASGATSYTWNPGNHHTNPYVAHLFNTTTYTLTGVDANGCKNITTQLITINPKPIINIVTDSVTICSGNTATLTASGATTYTWSTTQTGINIAVTPSVTTIYTVTGTDANGCVGRDTITQTVGYYCTGIEQINGYDNLVSVYPNPNNGTFSIEALNATYVVRFTIYDVNGKIVLSGTINSKTTIDANSLNAGVYNLSVTINNSVANKRIVIVK